MNAIILAGGGGTRLWPMSRASKPKQFFPILSDRPLIRETYDRLRKSFASDKIFAILPADLVPLLKEAIPEIADDHIVIEQERRDTGPAMTLACERLFAIAPDEPMVFIPSDHFIGNDELFLRTLSVGSRLVEETGKLLDIGVVPTSPNTGLGYSHVGEEFEEVEGVKVYRFIGHKEKPDEATARSYLKDGSYLWHANYYMWTPRKFLEAIDRHAPALRTTTPTPPSREIQGGAFGPKISFDVAVTEKLSSDEVLILKGAFPWSDVGTWEGVWNECRDVASNVPVRTDGMIVQGDVQTIDTTNSLIYSPPRKPVVIIGVKDLVVVDTGDALLVCDKSQTQRVKDAVNNLKEKGYHAAI
ncbi:mannose-1-phosphate guanylyltransferase [Candidatus Uhrbacteria bacterium]|nr:mannose-1-phosphate guanylyltransferase [Candidatus Uhrbacteria bacterium]